MGLKYKIDDQSELYFVTFTVLHWVDAFTRNSYRDMFINSVKYCQANKGLQVGAWVLMTNHAHMILGTSGQNKLNDIIRDMKSYISRHIRLEIGQSTYESRKEWKMDIFRKAGINNRTSYRVCLFVFNSMLIHNKFTNNYFIIYSF